VRTPTTDERRQRLILYGVATSGIILLGLVLVFLVVGRGGGGVDDSKIRSTMEAAGCTFATPPSEGRGHVGDLNAKIKYKTFPPTSGTHYFVPAIWDHYDKPVNEIQLVHNLEHGGVVIQYGSEVPDATVTQLGEFYRSDPNGMIIAPLPALGNKVALTAWTRLATCTEFDERAFSAFRDAYRYRGPEKFSPDAMQPGT
jgi:Protein of unknown function (DUF3105)